MNEQKLSHRTPASVPIKMKHKTHWNQVLHAGPSGEGLILGQGPRPRRSSYFMSSAPTTVTTTTWSVNNALFSAIRNHNSVFSVEAAHRTPLTPCQVAIPKHLLVVGPYQLPHLFHPSDPTSSQELPTTILSGPARLPSSLI